MDFIAIDFETATVARNSACALGLVEVKNGEIVGEREILIQPPGNLYDTKNISIHGIRPDDTAEKSTLEDMYDELCAILDGANVVAHNASFDISVLRASLEYYGLEMPQLKSESCTYRMSGKPLKECCTDYDIDLVHHDALSDAHACALLYLKLREDGVEMPKSQRTSHTTIKLIRHVSSESDVVNKNTIFFGKNIVITGVFENYERSQIADTMQSLGANVKSSISAKTDIVIRGADCGPAKMAKIRELKESRAKDILVIDEDYLIELLDVPGTDTGQICILLIINVCFGRRWSNQILLPLPRRTT